MSDVIIVDDEREILNILTQLLESEGYQVRPFSESRKALEAARAEPPGLALVDIMLPDLSGRELIRLLRTEVDAELPIVAMSASSNYHHVRDLHVQHFLEKPFDLEDVLTQVETVAGAVLSRQPV